MIFKIKQKKLKINNVVIITYKQYLTERFLMDKEIEGDPYKTSMGFDMWRIKNHAFMEREWDLYVERIEKSYMLRYDENSVKKMVDFAFKLSDKID